MLTTYQQQQPVSISTAQDALTGIFRTSATDNRWLLASAQNKDDLSRLSRFMRWLDGTGRSWIDPDLVAYSDLLKSQGLKPSSIKSNLATIRARYQDLLKRPDTKAMLREIADRAFTGASVADRSAQVANLLDDLRSAIDPALTKSSEKVAKHQDVVDSQHVRLTRSQSEALLSAPGIGSLKALRDSALIALALCTGIREAEAAGLNVEDLRQQANGVLGLSIRHGKGDKSRFVPYGALDWCLVYVDAWLTAAGIRSGSVFRGFKDRHTSKAAPGMLVPALVANRLTDRLTTRAIQQILDGYPVIIDGVLRSINPHDLRRTYARRLYDAGVDLKAIQANLGHNSVTTTERYIGVADLSARQAPAILSAQHDLKALVRIVS